MSFHSRSRVPPAFLVAGAEYYRYPKQKNQKNKEPFLMFSNLVATLRADFDAIKGDLEDLVETVKVDGSEFLETVKSDANSVLKLVKDGNGNGSNQAPRFSSWEEELWDDPDLLCVDPVEANWMENLVPLKEEEVDMFLNAEEGIVIELYRELVPDKASHLEFFQRLAYHRKRLARLLQQQSLALTPELMEESKKKAEMEEEETRWDDDEIIIPPTPPSEGIAPVVVGELSSTVEAEYKAQIQALQARVEELEAKLKESEDKRAELEKSVQHQEELPQKKRPFHTEKSGPPPFPVVQLVEEVVVAKEEEEDVILPLPIVETATTIAATATPNSSWEAISESNRETPQVEEVVEDLEDEEVLPSHAPILPVVPGKVTLDDEEEDDWN